MSNVQLLLAFFYKLLQEVFLPFVIVGIVYLGKYYWKKFGGRLF